MTFAWFGNADAIIAEAAKPGIEEVATFCWSTALSTHVEGKGYRSGDLQRSYGVLADGEGYTVGPGMDYAPHVEFGTKNMAAQGHLRKAAAATAAHFAGVTYTGGSPI